MHNDNTITGVVAAAFIILVFAIIINSRIREDDHRKSWIDQCIVANASVAYNPRDYCESLWRLERDGK